MSTTETTKPHIQAKFAAKWLHLLAPFVAKNDIRYYLHGICVRKSPKGGVWLTATNGHQMSVVHDEAGTITGADEVIIRFEASMLKAAPKPDGCYPTKKGDHPVEPQVLLDGQRVYIAPSLDEVGTKHERYVMPGLAIIEGKFPDTTRLLPAPGDLVPGHPGAINAAYLADPKGMLPKKYAELVMWARKLSDGNPDPNGIMLVQAPYYRNWCAVIMPMRGESREAMLTAYRTGFWAPPAGPTPLEAAQ